MASFWGDPGLQVVAGIPSLLRCDDQNLLEIEITKRVKIKNFKEKEKDISHPKQMGSAYNLNSMGSTLKPLGAEQDTTTASSPAAQKANQNSCLVLSSCQIPKSWRATYSTQLTSFSGVSLP